MKTYIILIISIIIDGLISNITLYQFNCLTYFTPLCTIVSLIFLYDDKNFVKVFLLSSILYGALYMSNMLLSFILFIIILLVIRMVKKLVKDNLPLIILQILLVVALYDGIFYFITSIVSMNKFSFDAYIYKLSHSIILNLLYGISLFFICDKKSSKLNH